MKSPSKLIGLLLALVLYATGESSFAQSSKLPAYSGHVNDFANVIEPTTKQKMDDILREFEKKTGAQIAVVTINTLGDRPLEDYATDLYRTWGIGGKSGTNRDKGALLLVVIQDRRTRLETGYGLEADIPDGLAGEIIRNMRPDLQAQNYSQGIMKGMRTIVDTLAAKWNVSLEGIEDRQFAYRGNQPPELGGKGLSILFILFIGFLFLMMFIGRMARGRASGVAGGAAQAIWWLAPLIFNRGGGSFGGGSNGGGSWGGSSGGGDSWGGFGGGESGGGGASDSW